MSTTPSRGPSSATKRGDRGAGSPETTRAQAEGPHPDRSGDRPRGDSREFERYALVAALTLLVLCLLWMDRTAGAAIARQPGRDALLRIELGGADVAAPAWTAVRSEPTDADHESPTGGSATRIVSSGSERPVGEQIVPAGPGPEQDEPRTPAAAAGTTLAPPGPPPTTGPTSPESIAAAGAAERTIGSVASAPPEPPKQRIYVVAKGDTLSGIARQKLGSTRRAKEIQELNDIVDANLIREGQILFLPGE